MTESRLFSRASIKLTTLMGVFGLGGDEFLASDLGIDDLVQLLAVLLSMLRAGAAPRTSDHVFRELYPLGFHSRRDGIQSSISFMLRKRSIVAQEYA